MSNIAIKIENLSKQYRLGVIGTGTLSHDLNRFFARLLGKEDPYLKVGEVNDRTQKGQSDYVWALKDINLEVQQGEVLGIIGKNGAGKSTLLKILSKVTAPTTGSIKAKGRIASLLEVGTGFHPELTGRENIFLNGAILGMTKAEIRAKLDEIVAFAGIEKYVDTPVKRYSSGMMVRLGFAVAAHLEPEILVVDEVLAVGDAEFQKKAIGKMQDVSRNDGRTVLFVSHNMASVKSLCTRGIVLENGQLVFNGNVDDAVKKYLIQGTKEEEIIEFKQFEKSGATSTPEVDILSIGIKATDKKFGDPIRMDDEIEFLITINKKIPNTRIDTTIQIKDENGNYLLGTGSIKLSSNANDVGAITHRVIIPPNFFNMGTFYANLLVVENQQRVVLRYHDILNFEILPKQVQLGGFMGRGEVPLRPEFKWLRI